MKKLKEEEATVEKVLAWLKDGKDVRKENWTTKEVSLISCAISLKYSCMMNKSYKARHNPSSLNGSIIQRRDRTEIKTNSDTKNFFYAIELYFALGGSTNEWCTRSKP